MAIVRFGDEKKNTAARANESTETALLLESDLASWEGREPPPREWAVQDVVPLRNVTLLSGEGAIGKSILMMQLCVAHVVGRDWIGFLPEPGPAMYLGAEDDEDELHRRLHAIVRHYAVPYSELKDLHLFSMAGKDALLGTVANRVTNIIRPTALFLALFEAVERIKPKLIVLDTAADVFGGNENDRQQVRQFVGLLRALAIVGTSAVLLASHPSVGGLASDSGLSGSTAWHNSVRARLYLKAGNGEAGTHIPGARVLEMRKSNYGPLSKQIALVWSDGIFKPVPGASSLEQARDHQSTDDRFLRILARYVRDGRNVSDRKGPNFAPALFAEEPEAEGVTSAEFKKAMVRLFSAKKIRMESYGRPSNPHRRMVADVLAI